MGQSITVEARWVASDEIWIATSADVSGLVVEGATWTAMIREVRLALPELLDLEGQREPATFTVRAEEHLDLVA